MKGIVNIGDKHGCLCIYICWAPREAFKAERQNGEGFFSPEGPSRFNASERTCLIDIVALSQRHSTEPMETKLWLNELTKVKQYELFFF